MASVSTRDLEELSAYLDQQLDPSATARLESRLKVEPELKVALEELSRTRRVLRSQSRFRAPRNFTLTPEQAGMKVRSLPNSGVFQGLRLASVLASALLVLVVFGELVSGVNRMAPAMAPQPSAADMALKQEALSIEPTLAVEVREVQPVSPTESPLQVVPPPALMGAAGATSQPEVKMVDEAKTSPGTLAMTASAGAYEAAALPSVTAEPTMTLSPAEVPAPEEELPTLAFTPLPEIPTETPVSTPIYPFRILEVALLLVAGITGLAAFFTRRSF